VGAGGPLGDSEAGGDLPVVQPLDDQAQHLPLTRSEVVAGPGKDARLAPSIRRQRSLERQHQLGQGRVLGEHVSRAELGRREPVVGRGAVAQHDHGRAEARDRAQLAGQRRLQQDQPHATRQARRQLGVGRRYAHGRAPAREQRGERAHIEVVAAANEQAEAGEVVAQEHPFAR
jgi:hypothetical protein